MAMQAATLPSAFFCATSPSPCSSSRSIAALSLPVGQFLPVAILLCASDACVYAIWRVILDENVGISRDARFCCDELRFFASVLRFLRVSRSFIELEIPGTDQIRLMNS